MNKSRNTSKKTKKRGQTFGDQHRIAATAINLCSLTGNLLLLLLLLELLRLLKWRQQNGPRRR